jgi:hypothetical protein
MKQRAVITLDDLRGSKCAHLNPQLHVPPTKTEVNKHLAAQKKKGSKYKSWITLNVGLWCNDKALELLQDHKFNQYRKFAFDWCIPALKIAIEYEGLMSDKSGHTSAIGYTLNTEKYNLAAADGWTMLRYTAINHNYKNVIGDLDKMYLLKTTAL